MVQFPHDPNQQWRRVLAQVRLPHEDIQKMLRTAALPQQQLREAARAADLTKQVQQVIDATRLPQHRWQEVIAEATRAQSIRLPDEQWSLVLSAQHLSEQQRSAVMRSARVTQEQWRGLTEAARMPQQQIRELIQASRLPAAEWARTLDALREAARIQSWASVSQVTSEFREALEDTEPAVAPDEARTSWLLNLTLVDQFAVFLAALKALDEIGKFLATLANDDLPPEVRAATQALFAVAAVLLMVIQLRTKPPDED